MLNVQRNQPCLCGSGMKFKRCHGAGPPLPSEVLNAARQARPLLRAKEAEEADRLARHGEGRPLIHAEFKGHKFVAVGPMVTYHKEWSTFPDFLSDHLLHVLGEDWFNIEIARPEAERHPVIAHRWGHYEGTRKLPKGPDGLIASVLTGHFAALLTLAYDLFVLQHNSAFRDDIVNRLRHQDQFAGARYELFAAATCVRAGMTVRHENERDRSRRHVEFIATHPELGIDVAVEAKQRQRAAGRPAVPGTTRPDVTSLVNAAMKKRPGMPFIVFVDLDMDPPPATDPGWIGRIEAEIRKEMGLRPGSRDDRRAAVGQMIAKFENRMLSECALIGRSKFRRKGLVVCRNTSPEDLEKAQTDGDVRLLPAQVTFLMKLKNDKE